MKFFSCNEFWPIVRKDFLLTSWPHQHSSFSRCTSLFTAPGINRAPMVCRRCFFFFFFPAQFLQGRQFAETNMKMAVASSHKHHLTNSQPECSYKNTAVKPVSPVYTDNQVVTELWCVAWGFTAIFSLSGFVINSQGYLKLHELLSRLEGKEINQIYDFAKFLN